MGGNLAHGLKLSIALLLCEAAKPSFRVIERVLPFFRSRISLNTLLLCHTSMPKPFDVKACGTEHSYYYLFHYQISMSTIDFKINL